MAPRCSKGVSGLSGVAGDFGREVWLRRAEGRVSWGLFGLEVLK